MNITITLDTKNITRFLIEYENYKINFEKKWLKKLDDVDNNSYMLDSCKYSRILSFPIF